MSKITLRDGDLARISVAASPSPAVEIMLSLYVLNRRPVGRFAPWQAQTRAHLGPPRGGTGELPHLRRVLTLAPTVSGQIQIVDAVTTGDGGALAEDIDRYSRAAIAPYWDGFRAALEAERAVLGRALLDGGPDGLLRNLHSDLLWTDPVLTIDDGTAGDRQLAGGGVTVLPSVFCEQSVVVPLGGRRSLLVHPMTESSREMAFAADSVEARARTLPNLLGATRAAILHALRDPYTTTEVARRHRLAPGTVSKHLSVLRDAGLVRSRRRANEVLYVVTPLGRALVDPVNGADYATG